MAKRGHVRIHRSAIRHGPSLWMVLITAVVLAGRFAFGQLMDGRRKTDATFWTRGTRATEGIPDFWLGQPTRWAYLAGWQRAAVRWACVAAGVGYLAHPVATRFVLLALAGAAAGYSAVRAYAAGRVRHHRRGLVRPTYLALCQHLGTSPTDRPERWLDIPADHATNPQAMITLTLPEGFDAPAGVREAIEGVIARRVPGEWDATWTATEARFSPKPQPPLQVTYADIYDAAVASPEHRVPVGVTARGRVKTIDIDGDAPHIAFSGGTGAGKSTFLRWTGAFLVNKGAEKVIIIDPKRISLRKPFKGVPNVFIYKDLEAQKQALADFRAEMEARYLWAESQEDEEAALDSLPRRVLIIEEGGTFFERVRQDWQAKKQKGDPAEPPAITDYRETMFMSRGAKCTVLLVVQSGNARDMGASAGTSAMRDQFAAKVLVRFSKNVWNMLVGTTGVPRAPKHKGRGYVVIGDDEDLVQLANPSASEARSFALEGEPQAPPSQSSTRAPVAAVPEPPADTSPANDQDEVPVTPGDAGPRGPALAVASRQYDTKDVCRALGINYEAWKQWRKRARDRGLELPEPTYVKNRPLWSEDQVDELKALREKAD